MNGLMGELVYGRMDGCIDEWIIGQMNGWFC